MEDYQNWTEEEKGLVADLKKLTDRVQLLSTICNSLVENGSLKDRVIEEQKRKIELMATAMDHQKKHISNLEGELLTMAGMGKIRW